MDTGLVGQNTIKLLNKRIDSRRQTQSQQSESTQNMAAERNIAIKELTIKPGITIPSYV